MPAADRATGKRPVFWRSLEEKADPSELAKQARAAPTSSSSRSTPSSLTALGAVSS